MQRKWDLNFPLGLIATHGNPIRDALLVEAITSHEMIINVVEAFFPGIQSLLFEIDELDAEPTPETCLTIATDTASLDLLDNAIILHMMFCFQMIFESLPLVAQLHAYTARGLLFIATPHLWPEVCRVFMSLPIVLIAKSFIASQEGAAVRPAVSLLAKYAVEKRKITYPLCVESTIPTKISNAFLSPRSGASVSLINFLTYCSASASFLVISTFCSG
jgi:hypothetical protein